MKRRFGYPSGEEDRPSTLPVGSILSGERYPDRAIGLKLDQILHKLKEVDERLDNIAAMVLTLTGEDITSIQDR